MIIDNLPTIPSTVTTGDELAVERGTTTYKIDYNALAAAILNRLGAGTDGIVDITHGGTGETTAAVHFEAQYSSLLDAINAVRSNRTFPISIQKSGFSSYSDLPSGIADTKEFCAVLLGDKVRLSCLLFVYDGGGSVFYRRFYNGSWSEDWKTLMGNNNILGIAYGGTGATNAAGARANLKVTPVLLDSSSGVTGLNVDFSSFGAFIIRMPDNMTTVVQIFGVPDAEFWSSASIYGDANSPVVLKSYCWKVNSSGTGFYLNTSKSYQINFSPTGTPSVHQITNNKFYKVWGIAN